MPVEVERGRPSLLTIDRGQQIIQLVRAGNYGETAAAYTGISKDTFYNWMRKGRDLLELEQEQVPPPLETEMSYLDFFKGVVSARAEAEARAVAIVTLAGERDWKAAAWYLERTSGNKFTPNSKVTVAGDPERPLLTADVSNPKEEFVRRLTEIRARQLEAESLGAIPESTSNGHEPI